MFETRINIELFKLRIFFDGITGDYDDFDDVEELIYFIRNGKRLKTP